MFCPSCGNELATVQVRRTERQLISARHYCAPCDLFYVYRYASNSIEIEYGAEYWMHEEQVAAEQARQMFLVFEGGRASAKHKSRPAALVLVNE